MAKIIKINEKIYNDLIKIKKEDESFDDLLGRLITPMYTRCVLERIRGSIEFKNKRKVLSEIYLKRIEVSFKN